VLTSLRPAGDSVEEPTVARHDAELGWVSVPHLDLEDAWGRGRTLRTNGRGFRGDRELAPEPDPGRISVVCSGDSFTYGEGVGDDSTW